MALRKNSKYDIKRKYFRVLQISFVISISILILAFKFFPNYENTTSDSNPPQVFSDSG
ncbi:MAG: hypothetical protein PF445_09090 [Melioribacteraceae bacterium]|jgi:hypothetical protein|nr:hypothetical protein [Melioribacteraceae bacterium]